MAKPVQNIAHLEFMRFYKLKCLVLKYNNNYKLMINFKKIAQLII